MSTNLDLLKEEIQEALDADHFTVFHGHSRLLEGIPAVRWDVLRLPDFKPFLRTAKQLDVRLIVYHQQTFTAGHIDEAMEDLQEAELTREERRNLERRLNELRMYEGFTCAIEMSFDFEGRTYLFEMRSEWFDELSDLLDEIDAATPPDFIDDEGDESMGGGYFSRN
jgi:hypothetical protein